LRDGCSLPITQIHDVTAALEDRVKEKFPQIARVTIHPEPLKSVKAPRFVCNLPNITRCKLQELKSQCGNSCIEEQQLQRLRKKS